VHPGDDPDVVQRAAALDPGDLGLGQVEDLPESALAPVFVPADPTEEHAELVGGQGGLDRLGEEELGRQGRVPGFAAGVADRAYWLVAA
jgi:hypothetical protein